MMSSSRRTPGPLRERLRSSRYRVILRLGNVTDAAQKPNSTLWLWAPAFAGATVKVLLARHQADHEPAADNKEIATERDLELSLRERMRGLHAERSGREAGGHHEKRADQRDIAERGRP